jgi:NodT family efflux transporter outer membrane factor (OMF) lipoprotein
MVVVPLLALLLSGCTTLSEYVHNGFKVGPNYGRPPAPVAPEWIDADDKRVRTATDDLSKWWTVFHDPVLDSLICYAYRQNLTLREAAFRVLQARAQLCIDVGGLFPQRQQMTGDYTRNAVSRETANAQTVNGVGNLTTFKRWFQQFDYGFNLSWELDFWGRLRRTIESSRGTLQASVEDYDDVLVTLLGDVATNYTLFRTTQLRIKYARENVALQQKTLTIVEGRFKAGTTNELDVVQARSTLEQTEAGIQELEITLRQTGNQLCILLGVPPEELQARLGPGPIPTAPPEVAAGIPADLIRRRPDVRRAERHAAAQCAQIGVAEAEFYPIISLNGSFGWSSQYIGNLFKEQAVNGTFGPAYQWNILNYGRLLNNVRFQDARFQELVAFYQNSVLTAAQDVENGLVTFLRAQLRERSQAASVKDAERAVQIALAQYTQGAIDLTRVTLLQQNLVQQQDTLALAQGEIVTGLIQVYRALGGGWQIRLTGCEPGPLPPTSAAPPTEELPPPQLLPPPPPAPPGARPASTTEPETPEGPTDDPSPASSGDDTP